MKPFLIILADGQQVETEYRILEHAQEMPSKYFLELKKYLIMRDVGADISSHLEQMKRIWKAFDHNRPADMLISLYDYINGLEQLNKGRDADQLALSVMLVEKDYDARNPVSFSESDGLRRMEILFKQGLTQGQSRKEVENFTAASPELLSHFLLTNPGEAMKKILESTSQASTFPS